MEEVVREALVLPNRIPPLLPALTAVEPDEVRACVYFESENRVLGDCVATEPPPYVGLPAGAAACGLVTVDGLPIDPFRPSGFDVVRC